MPENDKIFLTLSVIGKSPSPHGIIFFPFVDNVYAVL